MNDDFYDPWALETLAQLAKTNPDYATHGAARKINYDPAVRAYLDNRKLKMSEIPKIEKGTALRYNEGKADLSFIPLCTLEDEARVWEHGAKKYSAHNWMKGMKWSAVQASLLRHLSAWQRGEDLDPESGLPHLAHMSCNIRMLTLFTKTYPEGDDRPPKELL